MMNIHVSTECIPPDDVKYPQDFPTMSILFTAIIEIDNHHFDWNNRRMYSCLTVIINDLIDNFFLLFDCNNLTIELSVEKLLHSGRKVTEIEVSQRSALHQHSCKTLCPDWFDLIGICGLIDNSTLPVLVRVHVPLFSWPPSYYFLSDLIENDKFINTTVLDLL